MPQQPVGAELHSSPSGASKAALGICRIPLEMTRVAYPKYVDPWFNPFNAEAISFQGTKLQKCLELSEPCHVGIHWKALAEYYQMSTNVPGFQSFSSVFGIISFDQISHH